MSGDVVVVLANSWALDASDLAQHIVQGWAPDPLSIGSLSEASASRARPSCRYARWTR